MNRQAHLTSMLLFVVFMFAFVLMPEGDRASPLPAACGDEEMETRLRELMLKGVDTAFRERVQHLFEIWLKDDVDQPNRARKGIFDAVKGYVHSRGAIADWKLPRCEQGRK